MYTIDICFIFIFNMPIPECLLWKKNITVLPRKNLKHESLTINILHCNKWQHKKHPFFWFFGEYENETLYGSENNTTMGRAEDFAMKEKAGILNFKGGWVGLTTHNPCIPFQRANGHNIAVVTSCDCGYFIVLVHL